MPLADLQREADRLVWSRYGHAGVIVDENLQIHHFRGDTSPYLTPASGAASLYLLKMIRSELLADLRAAFQEAKKRNAQVKRQGAWINSGNHLTEVSIDVVPLSSPNSTERFFLILFDESSVQLAKSTLPRVTDNTLTAKLRQVLTTP